MAMIDRLYENIKTHELIEAHDTIIIGASGGPDSQFLIYLLNELKKELEIDLVLAHLNHLHRKEAIEDQRLVEATAKSLGLKFELRAASMDEYAKENKLSPEDAGRRLRYEFFSDLAGSYPSAKIAVAHNLDDQAETLLMRLIRGTGLDGLTGMDFKNSNIIRPILNISKAEILAYLDKNNIPYAIDQTNFSNDYTRNFIRNDIIPDLERLNPNLKEALYNLSFLARDDKEIINQAITDRYNELVVKEGPDIIEFDRFKLETLDSSYRPRLLRMAIEKINSNLKDISKANIDEFLSLLALSTGKEIIKDDLVFTKNYQTYSLKKCKESDESLAPVKLDLGREVEFGAYKIKAELVKELDKKNKNVAYFDLDKLTFPLIVRPRKVGDRFKPINTNHHKKVKDFFIDEKIDRDLRDKIPIIESAGEIIWLAPYRMSDDFKLDKNTKNILKIEVFYDF